eukprot:TRINITY_DN382_c0_g1_i6.p2 TRINITY_DN382_c0_g1~~TRINITY_DN382_c0_g1_i6.p2  ORF type:complete len:282 (+),score=47.16 TRINITY_DN382_c0_g1_i6:963-1808(+)
MMRTAIFFVVCLATVALAQPGITIDESLPCWLNLTGDMNVTYNEDILAAIDDYINETLIDAAASLPMDEQAILIATQILPVEKELLYVIAPPISLGDFQLATGQASLLASLAYPNIVQSPEYIQFLLGAFESIFYVCVDGEEIPDYSYIIQQAMELVFVGLASAFEPVSLVEPIIDQAAIAIAEDWNFTTNAGSRFDLILPDLVEGLNVGWKKLNNTEIDIDGIADRMAESVLALKFEDHNSTDAVGLAQEVIAELGLEVSEEFVNQMMALVEAYDLEDGN